jgi:prevent-host-death family protein
MVVAAGAFKARCLEFMDEVATTGQDVVVTKRGRPVARLAPLAPSRERDIFGCMAGSVQVHGDLTAPLEDAWEAMG